MNSITKEMNNTATASATATATATATASTTTSTAPVIRIIFAIDVSISMSNTWPDYGKYAETVLKNILQYKTMSPSAELRLITFSDTKVIIYDGTLVEFDISLKSLTTLLQPRNRTLLIDTLYTELCSLKPDYQHVLVVYTDGLDNMSRLVDTKLLSIKMSEEQSKGLTAIFAGSNVDCFTTATQMGFKSTCALDIHPANTEGLEALSRGVSRAISGNPGGFNGFTRMEREVSGADHRGGVALMTRHTY